MYSGEVVRETVYAGDSDALEYWILDTRGHHLHGLRRLPGFFVQLAGRQLIALRLVRGIHSAHGLESPFLGFKFVCARGAQRDGTEAMHLAFFWASSQ